ncbi:MAG TPA: cytosine permease [Candidatus Dormibacteraeota bacterium]|nr:cytosine permease [Candidatus Dormibacteraeota bacterium]
MGINEPQAGPTGVPVREGDYGSRVVAVEPGGVEYIPDRERHGRPLNLFWTWVSPNLEFATIYVGVLPVAFFGMGFADACVALLVGTALGSLTHAVLSSWGPRFGVPQMVQARAAFGYRGVALPAGLNAFTANVGWFIVNSVSGAFALETLFGPLLHWFTMPFWLAFLVIVLAQVLVAFLGHNLVHAFERYAFPYLTLVFLIAIGFVFSQSHPAVGINPRLQGPLGESGAFTLAFTAAFGYAVGWNPYASDYTRYLPSGSNRFWTGLWAGMGVFFSCILLEVAGAALVTVAGTRWGPNDVPTAQFIRPLPEWLATLTMLGIALGAVAANVLNIYSGAMSFLTLGIRLTLRQRRAIVALGTGVVSYAVGVALQAQVGPGSKYENFLLLISYWIAPFLAVVLTDYWLRRGRFDERLFYDPRHRPWKGFAAMLIGIVVSFPFWNNPLLTGPLPRAIPALGDVTFIVGFLVTAIAYLLLNRDLPGLETKAQVESTT